MSDVFPFPVLQPAMLSDFRNAVGANAARLYDRWLERHKDQCEMALRCGETLAHIRVDRDKWLAFCRATSTEPDLENLLYFTIKTERKAWADKRSAIRRIRGWVVIGGMRSGLPPHGSDWRLSPW